MLDPNVSPRGFLYTDPVPTTYGAEVGVGESSAAMYPRIWLWATQPPPDNSGALRQELGSVSAHLSVPQAEQIRDSLNYFIDKARVDWGDLDDDGNPIYDEEEE